MYFFFLLSHRRRSVRDATQSRNVFGIYFLEIENKRKGSFGLFLKIEIRLNNIVAIMTERESNESSK